MNRQKYIRFISVLIITVILLNAFSCVFNNEPEINETESEEKYMYTKEENGKNIRLGAYVWYAYSLLAWPYYTERMMADFLEFYQPEWGYGYIEVEDMEYQIDLAVENGLSFFSFEYWWNQSPQLNDRIGLDNFMKAVNRDKIDFCLLIANAGIHAVTFTNWELSTKDFVYYMTQDNYLKVDGKPVIHFFVPDYLINNMGGVDKTKQRFDELRAEMKDLGYPDILILANDQTGGGNNAYFDSGSSFSPVAFSERVNRYTEAGFDAVCGAMTYRHFVQRTYGNESELEKNFQELLDVHERSWVGFKDYTNIRLAPSLTVGWDDRLKWHEFSGVSYFYTREKSGDKFYRHVLNAYDWIIKNPDNALGNIAFIYSWDETDEGAQLIPTLGEGREMLYALNRAVRYINENLKT